MKRRKGRRRLSLGTVFMLLFTLLVVLGCAGFLLAITGGGMEERTAKQMDAFSAPRSMPDVQRAQQPAQAAYVYTDESPVPTASPVATSTPAPQKRTISIVAAGSVYAPKAVRETVQSGAEHYDFDPVFEGVRDTLSDADLSIVTLETTTAGKEKGYGNANTPPQILDALRDCGVDLISLGTERALDMGYDGLAVTLQEMTSRGLSYAGVLEEGQSNATVMRIDGVQVAVLAYSYGLSDEGEEKTEGDSRGALAKLDLSRVKADIAKVRSEGANLVIVLPHWGTKNKMDTSEAIRDLARELAAAGADLIFGTHPNVPQDVEVICAVRPDGLVYETLACYSLGSLLTDARSEENTAGMAVEIRVTYDPATRRVQLGEAEVTPLYIARTRVNDAPVYRVVNCEDEAAASMLDAAELEAAQHAAQLIRDVTMQGEEQ